jgi:DNA repair protein RadC
VALLLGSGTRTLSAVGLGREVLTRLGGLAGLARATGPELMLQPGIGQAKAVTLLAAFELARRRMALPSETLTYEATPQHVRLLQAMLADQRQEVFVALYFNRRMELLSRSVVAEGTQQAVQPDLKRILREALQLSATRVLVGHNHPSGNPTPSPEDLRLTQCIRQSLALLELDLVDHIIIAGTGYYSFSEDGLL